MDEYKMGYFQHTGHITTILNLSKLNFLTYNNFCKKKIFQIKYLQSLATLSFFPPYPSFGCLQSRHFLKQSLQIQRVAYDRAGSNKE